jgi:nucleoside-diphosphate kinase
VRERIAGRRDDLERTLTILKPDAVAAGHAGAILAHLEKEGFRLIGVKKVRLSSDQARAFYEVHRERPFYGALVTFMTEGPVIVAALERREAVTHLRKTMGATDSRKADAGTVRQRFGSDIERNAIHGSDSAENADREIAFFFSEAELI